MLYKVTECWSQCVCGGGGGGGGGGSEGQSSMVHGAKERRRGETGES